MTYEEVLKAAKKAVSAGGKLGPKLTAKINYETNTVDLYSDGKFYGSMSYDTYKQLTRGGR